MTERPQHFRFAASLFAVVAFILSFVLAELAINMGGACWEYAHMIEHTYPGRLLEPFEALRNWGCFVLGLLCGAFVFRVCRRHVAPGTVFHVAFGTGFVLLCFCLWLTLISLPLRGSALAMEWSTHVLMTLFSAPLTCLIFIPVAVLLLSYAISRDNAHIS